MTTRSLILHPHEIRAALAGTLGLVVRPVKPQPTSFIANDRGDIAWVHPLTEDEPQWACHLGEAIMHGCPFGVPGDTVHAVQLRTIPFGDGKYAVGDNGKIYNTSRKEQKERIVRLSHNGYEEVVLHSKGKAKPFRVNRIVAKAFYGEPNDGEVCRHLDGNRINNVPENLDWGTPQQNSIDAASSGVFRGENATNIKLTNRDVKEIRSSTETQDVIARKYGITQPQVSKIKNNKRWDTELPSKPPRNREITFSRITLEVVGVRCVRVFDLTHEDAVSCGFYLNDGYCAQASAVVDFWNAKYAKRGFAWDTNPWAWAVGVRRVKG